MIQPPSNSTRAAGSRFALAGWLTMILAGAALMIGGAYWIPPAVDDANNQRGEFARSTPQDVTTKTTVVNSKLDHLDDADNQRGEFARVTAQAMTIQGTVIKSKLGHLCRGGEYYTCYPYIFVDYAYDIDGLQLAGNEKWELEHGCLGLAGVFVNISRAKRRAIMARYAPRAAVLVHYLPSDPKGAWLTPPSFDLEGPPVCRSRSKYLVFGFIFLGLGGFEVIRWFRA